MKRLTDSQIEAWAACDDSSIWRAIAIELLAFRKTAVALETWTHSYGKALCPPEADTYGEGVRAAKRQVQNILAGGK